MCFIPALKISFFALMSCLHYQVMIHYATADHEKERLKYFVSPEGRDDLYQYNQRERRTVLEVHISSQRIKEHYTWF